MRKTISSGAVLAVALLTPALQAGSPGLDLVKLSDRVYAAVRRDPLSLAVNSNSLIVIRDSDVVVVDAQFTRAATQETIAAIRSVTRKPVRYVINTHWHDDHLAGDQVYQDSFPGVRFVMQANTAADLVSLGAPNREGTVQGAPPVADRFDRLLALGLGIDSTPVSAQERVAVTSALEIIRQYLKEAPGFRDVVATDTVQSRMTLAGNPRVDIYWFGPGNTRGDLVINLPDQRIVATGDLVVAPVPFGFASNPAEWIGALDSIAALRPRVLLPGHGPVMRNLDYLASERGILVRARDAAREAVSRGDSLNALLETDALDDERRRISSGEKWMTYLFNNFFLYPVLTRAYQEARKT